MRKKLQPHQKRFLKNIIIVAVIFLLPYIYFQPEYESLKEAEVTIDRTFYNVSRRGIGSFIRTTDEIVFKVGGKISSRSDFESKLTPNTIVQIKYYRGVLVFIPMNFIEELTVNNETIITYNNQKGLVQIICVIAGSLVFMVEFLFYADSAHLLKKLRNRFRNHKKQKKLDK